MDLRRGHKTVVLELMKISIDFQEKKKIHLVALVINVHIHLSKGEGKWCLYWGNDMFKSFEDTLLNYRHLYMGPNDDAFCGYHRYFEDKIISDATATKIDELTEAANDTYCKGITNPSESV